MSVEIEQEIVTDAESYIVEHLEAFERSFEGVPKELRSKFFIKKGPIALIFKRMRDVPSKDRCKLTKVINDFFARHAPQGSETDEGE